MGQVVRLIGEGGAEWEFELPLSEVYVDQVKSHALKPADDTAAAAVAHLLVEPDDTDGGAESSAGGDGSNGAPAAEVSPLDSMSGSDLNALAVKLEVDGWDKKAKVAEKRATLKAFIAAKEAEQPDGDVDDVADLSDEDLHAKAAELELDVDPDADRDTVLAAVRAKLGE